MSVKDKVKIIWKTSCQWQDRAHWPKRKDIKLRDGDTGTSTPLKPGDAVKIKFGSRWYDGEMVEAWEPRGKRGLYCRCDFLAWYYRINFFFYAFSMLRPIFFFYLQERNLVQILVLNLRRRLFLFLVHRLPLQELPDQQLMTPTPYSLLSRKNERRNGPPTELQRWLKLYQLSHPVRPVAVSVMRWAT